MGSTINSLNDGGSSVGTDEFVINRSGTDYKVTKNAIVASVESALSLEEANRISADDNLNNTKLDLAGGTMSGFINLHANPTAALHAVPKQYVDAAISSNLLLSGGTMTGPIVLAGDPTTNLQATTKQYVDGKVGNKWENTVDLDCSTSPDYSPSEVGTTYRVSVAGKVGGVTGKVVQEDDIIYCHTEDTTGGNEALVGSKYLVIQSNVVQATTTIKGISKIATNAEMRDGTNNASMITPLGLRGQFKKHVPYFERLEFGENSIEIGKNFPSLVCLCSGTTFAAVTIDLALLSSYDFAITTQITYVIKDAGNNAATNNIIINTTGGDTIDGASSISINTDSGSVTIINNGVDKWFTV